MPRTMASSLGFKTHFAGVPEWLIRLSVDFGSGRDLVVCGFEPHIGLCADSSEQIGRASCRERVCLYV